VIIGLDPGKNGGIAILTEHGDFIDCWPIPDTVPELINLVENDIIPLSNKFRAVVENVGAMPTDGRTSAFKFGRALGQQETVLMACHVSIERVTPSIWQGTMGCPRGLKGYPRKKWLKEKAHQLWPAQARKLTLKTADAALLAEWGRRHLK